MKRTRPRRQSGTSGSQGWNKITIRFLVTVLSTAETYSSDSQSKGGDFVEGKIKI